MKKIVDKKNILIQEVEEDDIDKWIKQEYKTTHPLDLIKETFRKEVMDQIGSDHHKSRDGLFSISYDFIEINGI